MSVLRRTPDRAFSSLEPSNLPFHYSPMETNDYLLANLRLCGGYRGWERDTKRLWPTLTKRGHEDAWGFSVSVGYDVGDNTAHWSGIVAQRHDKGIWVKVCSVRSDSAAEMAGLKPRDFITRINGQIVFHLQPKDVERLIRTSGTTLHLDIERDSARNLLYDGGLYGAQYNFLYEDYKPLYTYHHKRYV